ncbi:MAG: hypothetical protein CMD06_00750 [Flavobacteriales bacterium]|nr:hypothetical protein [Flavobacteriales bacterium]|tara:strand:- start:2193 stop:2462 length:270 start_codon:yes stop_codon:yes gene_type:complete
MILVEGIGKVTFVNDNVRVQTTGQGHDGTVKETGELIIPKGSIENVINGLAGAINDINTKLGEAMEEGKKASESGKEEKKKNNKDKDKN